MSGIMYMMKLPKKYINPVNFETDFAICNVIWKQIKGNAWDKPSRLRYQVWVQVWWSIYNQVRLRVYDEII